MEFAPFLLQERGVGSFLTVTCLNTKTVSWGSLMRYTIPALSRACSACSSDLLSARKHVRDTLIIELPSEDGGDLGHALGGTETVKALHQ